MSKNETLRRNSEEIIRCFTQLTAAANWQPVAEVKLNFPTGHPQGLVKIRDSFYVSSVEITSPPEKIPIPQSGYDRTPGEGVGFLFHVDMDGKLLRKLSLGEGTIYHPGGIDYDDESIWVPVAEYRPNSRSIIYRITPETLEVREVFRCNDHIGGLAYNRWNDTLHGITWGSRAFYDWTPGGSQLSVCVNGSHYIDYQDCQFLETRYMLCSGLSSYTLGPIALGGLELIDLERHIAIHQIPVPLYSRTKRPMTQNPFFAEFDGDCLRFYFLPDDNESTLYVYDIRTNNFS